MGKGDRKTAKGKRSISSYGNVRPHSAVVSTSVKKKVVASPKAPVAKKAPIRKKA